MTDEIVIERLAKRMGWTPIRFGAVTIWRDKAGLEPSNTDLLGSVDALQPVLKTLTEEEWNKFISLPFNDGAFKGTWAKFYLTLPPKTLAFKIAEVIE
jgi:hypothetical protein